MKKILHPISLILVMALLTSLAVGLTTAQDEMSVLTIGDRPNDPRSIDPQQTINIRDWYLMNLLFPGLVRLDEESGEMEAGLVSSWEVSEDGLTTTFHLLEGVNWVRYNLDTGEVEQVLDDDGNPRIVTAHDVAYGWERALSPDTGAYAAFMLAPVVEGAAAFNAGEGSVEDVAFSAVDDFTFEVTAPEQVGFALPLYGLNIARPVPQWAIEEFGDSWIEPENIQSYGPYALKDWVHEESLDYIKNPFWPGSDGYSVAQTDELIFRFLDESVGLREYEAGNLDVLLAAPADQIPRLRADPTLSAELNVGAGACSTAWGMHVEKAPFDNVHIRRAFSYAVDRQSLVDNILQGAGIPAPWFTPPSINLSPQPDVDTDIGLSFDAATAQEELQMGLDELGLASVDELPPITAVFRDREGESNQAQALQVMWEDTLGIRVELAPQDSTTYWAMLGEDAPQIHLSGWCPDYNDPNNFTRDVYRSDGVYNYGRYNNPQFDEMVDAARLEPDPEARREMYRQIEELLIVEDAAIIPSHWPAIVSLTKPYVQRTFVPNEIEAFWKWSISE